MRTSELIERYGGELLEEALNEAQREFPETGNDGPYITRIMARMVEIAEQKRQSREVRS